MRSIFVPLILCCLSADIVAQWAKVSPGVFPGLTASGGMLHFKNGVLWGGFKTVSYSLDTGKTWTLSIGGLPINENVQVIDFIDDQTGLVRTNNFIYITTNRGATWTLQVAPGGAGSRYTAFVGSASRILSLASQGAYLSQDGGATWALTYLGAVPNIIAYRSSGTLAIFEGSRIVVSTNSAASWQQKPALFGLSDSYSFMWDVCDSNTLYLSNEDFFRHNENWSEVFVTTDRGGSWTSKIRRPLSFFNGGMTISPDAAYFQTISNGVFRTTDYGATWDSISGPNNLADTRWLIALTSQLLLGVDVNGDLWRTDNSGGVPINTQIPVFSPQLTRTSNSCNRDSMRLISGAIHCRNYTITKAILSGPDTAFFSLKTANYPNPINLTKYDTIKIYFDSKKKVGSYLDTLRLSWLDAVGVSHDSIFVLSETVAPPIVKFTFIPPFILFDTISPCVGGRDTTVTLRNTGCDSLRITNQVLMLDNPFSVDTLKLPIILAPDSSIKIRYHFRPKTPGTYSSNDPITAEWMGVQYVNPIQMSGRGTSSGFAGVAFDTLLNVDTVSSCSPNRDTMMRVRNLGCDTMRITSGPGKLALGFSFDSVAYPLIIPPGSSVILHFHFRPPAIGSYASDATFGVDWHGYAPTKLNTLIAGVSNGSVAGPIITDSLFDFQTVSVCDPLRDTTIQFKNQSCDTLLITSGPARFDSNFTSEKIIYPIVIPPDSIFSIRYHFHPKRIGKYKLSLNYSTLREGVTKNLKLSLSGESAKGGALPPLTNASYDFGSRTTCDPPMDTLIVIKNRGCDTLSILNGPGSNLSLFSMDPIAYPATLAPDSSITLHFHFNPNGVGNYSGSSHFLTSRSGIQDSVNFLLNGSSSEGAATLSLSKNALQFNDLTICSSDSLEMFYTNSGCDSLFVSSLGCAGDLDFNSASSAEKVVLPGDTVRVRVHFLPKLKGQRSSIIHLQYHSRFGNIVDTLIPIIGKVVDGSKILTQSMTTANLGYTTLCQTVDTLVRITNSGCDTISLTGADIQGSGFFTGATFPIILLPGNDTLIHFYGVLDTAGKKPTSTEIISIKSTSDLPLSPITLSRSYSYRKLYPLRFEVPKVTPHTGDTTRVLILADSLPNDLTRVETKLKIGNSDLMSYLFVSSPNAVTINGDDVTITGNPIIAPKGKLAELGFKIYLTKDSVSSITLSGTTFNSSNADYAKCIAASQATNDSIVYRFECGERTILETMNNNLAAQLLGIYPNPARNKVELSLFTTNETSFNISIFDARGIKVLQQSHHQTAGKASCTLDVSKLGSGAYTIRLNEQAIDREFIIAR
ncbi:MAG: choice-of-anchor D domain-containing protein [bacterium]